MFAGVYRNKGTGREINKQAFLGSFLTTPNSYYNVVIYDDISLPRTGPLKFFRQLRERQKGKHLKY